MSYLVPSVDSATFLFPEKTMDALRNALPGATETEIAAAVDDYLTAHPIEGATTDYVDEHVETHVVAATPHPAYDDMPSLTLIFENGLA